MNKVVGVALAGVALYGLVRLLKMQSVSDLASLTLVNPRVHNVSLAGMSLRTEVAVNNASRDSVKVYSAIFSARFLTYLTFCAYIFMFAPKFCLYCTHK